MFLGFEIAQEARARLYEINSALLVASQNFKFTVCGMRSMTCFAKSFGGSQIDFGGCRNYPTPRFLCLLANSFGAL